MTRHITAKCIAKTAFMIPTGYILMILLIFVSLIWEACRTIIKVAADLSGCGCDTDEGERNGLFLVDQVLNWWKQV